VDVIAVDHAGSGDVHGVEILYGQDALRSSDISSLVRRVKDTPLHFKYVAMPRDAEAETPILETFRSARSFDVSGIGRVGLICYSPTLLDESSATETDAVALIVKPERFLLRGERLTAVEKFLSRAKPDISVRI
jgi:hypothetical protein